MTLYTDVNYGGSSYTYSENTPFTSEANDHFSSAKTTFGCAVVLYEDANYQGRSLIIMGEVPDLSVEGFNDIVSSVWIAGGI